MDLGVSYMGLRLRNPVVVASSGLTGALEGLRRRDLAAATGVHDGIGVARQLLAGATAVQLCSTLMQHGVGRIGVVIDELGAWMERHGFSTVDEFRGKLSRQRSGDPQHYERLQYLKVYGGLT